MMNISKHIFLLGGIAFTLGACSNLQTHRAVQPNQSIDLTRVGESREIDNAINISRNLSNNSVRIFSPDGSDAQDFDRRDPITQVDTTEIQPVSGGISTSSSVEVFPVGRRDDFSQPITRENFEQPLQERGAIEPLQTQSAAGSQVAPDQSYQEFASIGSQGREVGKIFFGHDSSNLGAKDRDVLGELADLYKNNPFPISIEGHASPASSIDDPIARKMINLRVSMKRAFTVAETLIEKGVSPDDIRLIAYGEGLYTPSGDQSNALARRVDLMQFSVQ